MAPVFWDTPWPGLFVWVVLYISDYYLTITCARMYQNGVKNAIAFEGSYEITPYFQKDVDALGLFSLRFLVALIGASLGLVAVWWLSRKLPWPGAYALLLGAMIAMQLAVHVRHWRNFALFRAVLAGTGVSGRIEYGRPVMLHVSSIEFVAFAALFGVCFLITWSWFLLGGTAGCLSLALKHRTLANTAHQRSNR